MSDHPLKPLLKYISNNIYPKLKKKDVVIVRNELMQEIEKYRKAIFLIDCDKLKKEYEWKIENLQSQIDNPNRPSSDVVYPKGSCID